MKWFALYLFVTLSSSAGLLGHLPILARGLAAARARRGPSWAHGRLTARRIARSLRRSYGRAA